jgi:hypothetical protein
MPSEPQVVNAISITHKLVRFSLPNIGSVRGKSTVNGAWSEMRSFKASLMGFSVRPK